MADTPPQTTPPKSSKDWPPLEKVAPPKREKTDTPPKRPPGRPPGKRSLKDRLTEFISGIGMVVMVVNTKDGEIILTNAESMAESWVSLANSNPAVRANLERVLTGGAWGSVVMVHFTVLFQIAQNHGIGPELTFMPSEDDVEGNGQPDAAP